MDPSAPERSPEQPSAQDIFIGRQPILDRQEQLVAYELLFRSGRQDHARIDDDVAATASVISHTFNDFGVEEALGPHKGFINVSAEMLLSDAIELLPCDKIVLELLETIRLTPAVVTRCRELQQGGFALALDDLIALSPEHRSILEFVDIVKVDVKALSETALAAITAELRPYPARLLAEKVDTRGQVRHCMDLGYALFQGYYFARPAVISGRKLSHSEMSLLRLLGLLLNDADTRALEGMFKQEPGLSMNLLRLANSAGAAAHGNIASLRNAITLLGRRQLTRWLQILLFTNSAAKGCSTGA